MSRSQTIRIGLLGLGTVGRAVLDILDRNAGSIETAALGPCHVERALVRSRDKPRTGIDPSRVTTDPAEVLGDPSVEVIVEVMGGIDPALSYVRRALKAGKSVVTANKALLAAHAEELCALADEAGVDLYFEAAVAGGIPIIRTLREALASDRILSVVGIVNGTCNFILSQMTEEGSDFATALTAAQQRGYAEADPSLDVDGLDAAHKLTILATLAFGARLRAEQISVEGIGEITPLDIAFARRFGYVVKPLAIGKDLGHALDLRVHPALIPHRSVLASVSGALNAVYLQGEAVGPCWLSGYGAGGAPTAVSVVSDLIDVVRNRRLAAAGRVTTSRTPVARAVQPAGDIRCRAFLRMTVQDRPGVLARIAGALGAHDVSIEQMVQEGHGSAEPVQLVMLTHVAREQDVRNALGEIDALTVVAAPTRLIRIEE